MASNTTIEDTNGNYEQKVFGKDVKILVVGDRLIGKSAYIEKFAHRFGNADEDVDDSERARMYSARYEVGPVTRYIKIFEIFGGTTVEQIDKLTKDHYDNYGIIFMYAIDNPSSFESIATRWIPTMITNKSKEKQPCIVVANKRDLRNNPTVINRLALLNQALVPTETGENFARGKMAKYFETFSLDKDDDNIHKSFNSIVVQAIPHYREDTGAE